MSTELSALESFIGINCAVSYDHEGAAQVWLADVAQAFKDAGFVRLVSDSDTVERVAKAIWLDECHRYADIPAEDWSLVAQYVKVDYRRHAKVAIEAMKETK